MKKTIIKSVALAVMMTGMASTTLQARDGLVHMKVGDLTTQPIGHHWYCQQYKDDCKIRSRNTNPVPLTRARWQDLVEVNSHSNNTIKPVTDLEAYNKDEHWVYPVSYGDCEDYVLQKRQMLMKRGWPASALLITVVLQPNGEGHAVLTVRTDRGDFILDNLDGKIRIWNETPYTFLKRQASNHSGRWATIHDLRG